MEASFLPHSLLWNKVSDVCLKGVVNSIKCISGLKLPVASGSWDEEEGIKYFIFTWCSQSLGLLLVLSFLPTPFPNCFMLSFCLIYGFAVFVSVHKYVDYNFLDSIACMSMTPVLFYSQFPLIHEKPWITNWTGSDEIMAATFVIDYIFLRWTKEEFLLVINKTKDIYFSIRVTDL